MKTLVVGYGNETRSDDGVGLRIAERLAELHLPDVEIRTVQQLHVEILEDFQAFERILLIDASSEGEEVDFWKVSDSGKAAVHSSHACGPVVLRDLSDKLYGRTPDLFVCSVRAEDFEFGETLSEVVEGRAQKALTLITKWLQEEPRHA